MTELMEQVKYLRDNPQALNTLPRLYKQTAEKLIEELDRFEKKGRGRKASPSGGPAQSV